MLQSKIVIDLIAAYLKNMVPYNLEIDLLINQQAKLAKDFEANNKKKNQLKQQQCNSIELKKTLEEEETL